MDDKFQRIKPETFTDSEVESAIRQWLNLGDELVERYKKGEIPMPCAYFSGNGWAARCLRYHLQQLEKKHDI